MSKKKYWKKPPAFACGCSVWIEREVTDLVPSVSTFLMRMNPFQYTQGEEGISCFGNFSWHCNLYGPCLRNPWSAETSVVHEEDAAHFPHVTRCRVAEAGGNLWVTPAPRAGRTTPLDLALKSAQVAQALLKSIFECLQRWRFHSLPGQPEGSAGETCSWTAEG